MTGIDITYVPYKGSAPALTDFIAGRIPVHVRRILSACRCR